MIKPLNVSAVSVVYLITLLAILLIRIRIPSQLIFAISQAETLVNLFKSLTTVIELLWAKIINVNLFVKRNS